MFTLSENNAGSVKQVSLHFCHNNINIIKAGEVPHKIKGVYKSNRNHSCLSAI